MDDVSARTWAGMTMPAAGVGAGPDPHLGIGPGSGRLAGVLVGTALVGLVALAIWPARARIKARFGHLEERHS